MSKFCSECGAPLKMGAKFCSECGHKVVTTLAQDSTPKKSLQEIYAERKAAETSTPPPMPYDKPKTIQEIFAQRKAATQNYAQRKAAETSTPPPMPYDKPKTIQEIFAQRKAAETSTPPPMPYDKPKTMQEIFAERKAATQNTVPPNYNQSYQKSESGSWWYETFLRKDGRLNRLRFFKRTMLSSVIGLIGFIIIYVVLDLNPDNLQHTTILGIVYTAFVTYLDYGLIVRRSHDLSREVYWYKYIKDEIENFGVVLRNGNLYRNTISDILYLRYCILRLVVCKGRSWLK